MKYLLYLFVLFVFFIASYFLYFEIIYLLATKHLMSMISSSFLKIVGIPSFLLEGKYLTLEISFIFTSVSLININIVTTFLLSILFLYTQKLVSSFPKVLTRRNIIMFSFTVLLILINFNLFWVIQYLTMLSRHSWEVIEIIESNHSLKSFINYTLYFTTIASSTLFMYLTVCSNLFIALYLAVKFYYAYLTEAEFLIKRLLLILPKIKSLDIVIKITFSYFWYIMVVCLSVSVLLIFSHTLDLYFVYQDLNRMLEILLAKNEQPLYRFFWIEVVMIWVFVIVVMKRGVNDLEEIFEYFFIFYRSLFIFLAMLLPFYPPVL